MAWICYDIEYWPVGLTRQGRRGGIRISYEYLHDLLDLPDDIEIIAVTNNHNYNSISIRTISSRFPIHAEGAELQYFDLISIQSLTGQFYCLEDNDDNDE
jgi:hypothetical protein